MEFSKCESFADPIIAELCEWLKKVDKLFKRDRILLFKHRDQQQSGIYWLLEVPLVLIKYQYVRMKPAHVCQSASSCLRRNFQNASESIYLGIDLRNIRS